MQPATELAVEHVAHPMIKWCRYLSNDTASNDQKVHSRRVYGPRLMFQRTWCTARQTFVSARVWSECTCVEWVHVRGVSTRLWSKHERVSIANRGEVSVQSATLQCAIDTRSQL